MGQSKGLVVLGGHTLVERACRTLKASVENIFVSLREEQISDFLFLAKLEIQILKDELKSVGPAAALLRAHREFPQEEWLVFACDFVTAHENDIKRLTETSKADDSAEIICYQNSENISEPLFAVWRPSALQKLAKNVSSGEAGPSWTLKQCLRNEIKPTNPESLFNANTLEDLSFLGDGPR